MVDDSGPYPPLHPGLAASSPFLLLVPSFPLLGGNLRFLGDSCEAQWPRELRYLSKAEGPFVNDPRDLERAHGGALLSQHSGVPLVP